MAKRSLQASPEGAKLARKIFDRRGWTQEGLATELDLRTRQPIWRFFTCRPIERYIFIELCSILDLNWWEIADNPPEPLIPREEQKRPDGAAQLSGQVRSKHQERIEHQCRFVRVLGTSFPVQIERLFVSPSLLSQLVSQEHLDVAELEHHYANSLSRSPLSRLSEALVSVAGALTTHLHVQISGKPGSGKTTLLKWAALQCQQGVLHADLIPVLVRLGHYVGDGRSSPEFSLLSCIQQELRSSGISDLNLVETLVQESRLFLLIDELDEIPASCRGQVTREICKFFDHFYKTRAIIVSRLAQGLEFPQFINFELADLNDEQIQRLVRNWFEVFNQDSRHRAESLIQQLKASENQRIYELAQVPLFLNRICQIFQVKEQLFEVRDRIYEECFTLLIKGWAESKGTGDLTSHLKLSTDELHHLGQLGISLLKGQGIFFDRSILEYLNQPSRESVFHADRYLSNGLIGAQPLGHSSTALTDLALRHGLILEQAKGIFSFAYLAVEEYLVAWKIVTSLEPERAILELTHYLTEPRWHEVVLMVCSMLPDKTMLLQLLQEQSEALVLRHPAFADLVQQLKRRSYQFLLWQQTLEIDALFCQLANSPRRLDDFAQPIYHFKLATQHLLLNIVLEGLQLWSMIPSPHSAEVVNMLQYLLEQAVRLTQSLGYPQLLQPLLELQEQLLRSDSSQSWTHQKWRTVTQLIATEWSAISAQEPLYLDQIQDFCSDLSTLQVFAECVQKAANSNHFIRLQPQVSDTESSISLAMTSQLNNWLSFNSSDTLFSNCLCYHWLNFLLFQRLLTANSNFSDSIYRKQNAHVEFQLDTATFGF